MDLNRRNKLVARLLAGITPVRSGDGVLYQLKEATPETRLVAEELYQDSLTQARDEGLMEDADAIELAAQDTIWDTAKSTQLDKAQIDLDDLKVSLYECYEIEEAREKTRARIVRCRDVIASLTEHKWYYRDKTVNAYAAAKKARAVVGLCLYKNGSRVFGDDPQSWSDSGLIDVVVEAAASERASESELREIARTTPWQGYWAVGKPNPFGVASVDLGDDRLALCNFSIMYDRVDESPDRPSRDIINDDDALDGWLITQRRNQGEANKSSLKDRLVGSVGNMQEVFVPIRRPEEIGMDVDTQIKMIHGWNDFESRRQQKARFKQVEEQGVVAHINLKDVNHDIGNKLKDMELAKARG